MILPRRRLLNLLAGAAAVAGCPRLAMAQSYPARPVRMIVPFAPGGQTDVVARLVAQRLSERLGKQFYIENAAGGGGNIGVGRAAQADPDGYSIVLVDGIAFAANPALYATIPYDPIAGFEPVGVAATTMQVLAVNPSVPANTVQELVALIKSSPGKFSYASAGVGTGRRPAQRRDPPGQDPVAVVPRLPDPHVAGRDEITRVQAVELVGHRLDLLGRVRSHAAQALRSTPKDTARVRGGAVGPSALQSRWCPHTVTAWH